jgi:hypothetical protein
VKRLGLLVIAVVFTTIFSGCKTPVWVFAPEDHAWTSGGDTLTIDGVTVTTRYDGVWMRSEVDKVLHDARWKAP